MNGVQVKSFTEKKGRKKELTRLLAVHSLTPQKGIHSFRYFLPQISYCCLLMYMCIIGYFWEEVPK